MEDLGSILPKALHKHVLQGKKPVLQILAPLWPRVVGKFISQVSEPVAFDDGTLTVAVSSPTWATQLQAMSDPLRAQINNSLGSAVVTRLRIHKGAVRGRRPESFTVLAEMPGSARAVAPQLEPIPDLVKFLWMRGDVKLAPELAEVVERSFVKYFSRNGKLAKV